MELLNGRLLSKKIKKEIKKELDKIKLKNGKVPHLAVILVGNNEASKIYVNNKIRACKEVGFQSTLLHLQENISEDELLKIINNLNNDDKIDGFIVQLPLPEHIDKNKVILSIKPEKDIDGFHPVNLGKIISGLDGFIPATPLGILELIKRYKIQTEGKHCVVVGRSNIVGLPISILMGRNTYPGNATVTLTHSRTKDLASVTSQADILITALGKAGFIKENMVKESAVVIDVGITRVYDKNSEKGYVIRGDVDFENVADKCSYITPVPGGVGPMTIVSLLFNTLKAAKGIKHQI